MAIFWDFNHQNFDFKWIKHHIQNQHTNRLSYIKKISTNYNLMEATGSIKGKKLWKGYGTKFEEIVFLILESYRCGFLCWLWRWCLFHLKLKFWWLKLRIWPHIHGEMGRSTILRFKSKLKSVLIKFSFIRERSRSDTF